MMIKQSDIQSFEDIQIAKQEVKKRIRMQETVLQKHFQQLPKEMVSSTLKAALPSIISTAISSTTAGTALNAASGIAGYFLSRRKEKHEQKTVLKQNVQQGGLMLLGTLATTLLRKLIK